MFQFRMIMVDEILRLINIGKLLIKHREAMVPRQCGELITDNKVDLRRWKKGISRIILPYRRWQFL